MGGLGDWEEAVLLWRLGRGAEKETFFQLVEGEIHLEGSLFFYASSIPIFQFESQREDIDIVIKRLQWVEREEQPEDRIGCESDILQFLIRITAACYCFTMFPSFSKFPT